METKTEEMVEERETVKPIKKRKYWEFGMLLFVLLIIAMAIGALIFLGVKKIGNKDAQKISIQDIPEEMAKDDSKKNIIETTKAQETTKNETDVPKNSNPLETSVKILNGGSFGGSAGKMKTLLVEKGYKKLEVGNSNVNYSGTTIFYQAEFKAVAEKILSDLKPKYSSAQIKPGASVEEKSGSVVIILGK